MDDESQPTGLEIMERALVLLLYGLEMVLVQVQLRQFLRISFRQTLQIPEEKKTAQPVRVWNECASLT